MTNACIWPIGGNPPGFAPGTVKRLRYPKGPTDLTPVTGDFRGVLSAIDNDSLLTSFTPTIKILRNDGNAADLYASGTPAFNDDQTRVSIWLAGGTANFEYIVSITVQSVDEQMLTRSFIIPVNWR